MGVTGFHSSVTVLECTNAAYREFFGFLFYYFVYHASCENYSYTHLSRKSEFIKLSQDVDCSFNSMNLENGNRALEY